MKPNVTFLFCTLLLAAAAANAQTSGKSAVQSHVAAARDAAYEPGNDLTVLYDTVCAPALSAGGPKEPNIQTVAESRAPQSGPRAEWPCSRLSAEYAVSPEHISAPANDGDSGA